jgi:hypothetical protein
MKIQQLGRLTELPKVPEGEYGARLIIEDQIHNACFLSYLDEDDIEYWIDCKSERQITQDVLDKAYPNGFDAVLITFEPE